VAKTIEINDNVYFILYHGSDKVPMIQITEMSKAILTTVTLTCDEMNKLIKEYLAQQIL